MKTSTRVVALLIAGLSFSPLAHAKQVTMEQALQAAAEHDMRLTSIRAKISGSSERIREVAGQFLPSISGIGSVGATKTQNFNENGIRISDGSRRNRKNIGLQAKQAIPVFGRQKAAIGYQRAVLAESQYELRAMTQKVYLETVDAWLNLRGQRDVIEALNSNVKVLQDLLNGTEEKAKLQIATITEVQIVRARLSEMEAQLSLANAEHRQMQSRLTHLTGISAAIPNGDGASSLTLPRNVNSAISMAEGNAPEVMIYSAKLDQAKLALSKATLDLYPSLSVGAKYIRGRQDDLRSGTDEVMLNVSVPLYDGGIKRSKKRQAKHDISRAKSDLRHAQDRTKLEVQSSWHNVQGSRDAASAWNKALTTQVETIAGIQQSVDEGVSPVNYLLEATERKLQTELQAIRAKVQERNAQYKLLSVVGLLRHVAEVKPVMTNK